MRLSIATPPDHPFLDGYSPALIQPPLYHADGQILDEVYVYGSFLQSRMYGAGVTCSDCHEPHSLELRAPGGQVCLQCHLGDKYATVEHQLHPEGAGNPDCIACHMPATTYMQVDERSDHSFRVPRPDLSVRYGLPNACSACHAQGDEWAADILTEAGRLSAGSHWRDKLVASYAYGYESVQNLAELALDSEVPAIIRASAASRLQMDYNPGSLQLLTALTTNDDALIRRGAAQALQASHPQLAVELGPALLDDPIRAVRLVTVSALARVDPVLLPAGSHTRLQRALDEYIEIQLVNSERAESYLNIATMRRSQNQLEDAESALRVAMQLNEHFVPVYINLADLYRLWEREAEAEQTLRQGLQKVPEDPSLHHALGLSLVRQAKTDAALAELQLAADSAAASPRYALVYAVALDSSGKTRDAVAYLQVAVKRFANDPQLVQLLEELKSR
jgi:tetratricopeptide (TPR) repeat protein